MPAFPGSPRICATGSASSAATGSPCSRSTPPIRWRCSSPAAGIGAVFLPLNTRLTVPELHYIVGDAAPVLMIHDAELAEVALSVAKLCKVASTLLLGPDGSYEAAIAARKTARQGRARHAR